VKDLPIFRFRSYMRFLEGRGARSLLLAVLILISLSGTGSAYAAGSRDVLWSIISSCLDPGGADYCTTCRAPRAETTCAAGKSCRETTEVWAENAEFVALRDRKMCDCPEDFVHGLVLPRARVTGVEDPHRPDGIWSFAWAVACSRLGDDSDTALAVNPRGMRDQDQLHVHIVRLQPDARKRFVTARTSRVQKLDEVWGAASRVAAAAGLADYGVLVTRNPEGGFTVLVDKGSIEKNYSIARCSSSPTLPLRDRGLFDKKSP
jgi:CDP-diacylglycerol pyrophosphatase